MKGKLLFVTGAAVGYVLGTRAGRKRYEQIKEAASGIWNTPTVQQSVDQAKGFALARVSIVSDAVFDGAKKLVNAAAKQGASTPQQQTPTRTAPAGTSAASPTPATTKPAATKPSATKSASTEPSTPNSND
ncbi:hypothetical protein [Microterricola viridarii]|uniref:YtxH domain-containing protein n=1 Tax=Microterricola viridarii TaxID=412690 RepID=A0A1H1LQ48_9MICO|nr:hypothetical protein [Microterricola viridarii]SDR76693.1 hypothetical protein SAMN04489834_0182 [Microterricola viridarii]